MELYTLNISVSNQKLEFGENLPEIYSGDQSIDYVQFTFDDSKWDGFTDIWAVFNRYRGRSYQVELENGKAKIPAEVMINGGHIFIGLLGTDGENVQTSSVLEYSIGQGAANSDLIAPSENIYEQFLSDLDAYQTAKSELESIESRLVTAETTIQNLEPRVTAVDTTVSNMEDTVGGLVSDVSGMRTTVDGLLTDVANLQTSVSAMESAVPTLQRDVSALQTGVTNLESRMTALSTSVGSLEDRLTTVQTSLTDLEDGLTDAEGRLTTIGNQITDAQTDIEEIETAIEQDNIVTDVTTNGTSLVNNRVADLSFMTVTDTATGSIATFPDGSGLNAVGTEIEIVPKQAGSGTPSPDNVREISGWNSVKVTGTGKNVIPFVSAPKTELGITVTYDSENSIITLNGTTNNQGNINLYNVPNVDWVIGQRYTMSVIPVGGSATLGSGSGITYAFGLFNSNYSEWFRGHTSLTDFSSVYSLTSVAQFDATNSHFLLQCWRVGTVFNNFKIRVQIELGTTATAYEPYNGISTTINLGQTVYGATIYPEEGRGEITMGMVDLGTLTWLNGGGNRFTAAISNMATVVVPPYTNRLTGAICSKYPADTQFSISDSMTDKTWIRSDKTITIKDTAYTDATSFKTSMNGVQLCYQLATPISFTFPAVNIPTLNGTNNVWADSGDVSVEYIANLKKYIEKVVNS